MKLLLDENLSPRLVGALADVYPGSVHVRHAGLESADDAAVWAYARAHQLTVVSKDSDFHQRALLFGPPPRVVWIRRGNCSTREVERILRDHRADLEGLADDPATAVLVLV